MGALDGSHVPAVVAAALAGRFRNRKNFISQNVLGMLFILLASTKRCLFSCVQSATGREGFLDIFPVVVSFLYTYTIDWYILFYLSHCCFFSLYLHDRLVYYILFFKPANVI